jgi:hypothetical protein
MRGTARNPSPKRAFDTRLLIPTYQSNRVTYESACPWDIYSRPLASEMLNLRRLRTMEREDYLDGIHTRVARVTEDLRAIQRELNCAAMEAPNDPELMEALSQLPEMDSLQVLKSAVDQMRHFLWFYIQVMTNETEAGDKMRQSIRHHPSEEVEISPEAAFLKKCRSATDTAILRYLSDGKNRKPN